VEAHHRRRVIVLALAGLALLATRPGSAAEQAPRPIVQGYEYQLRRLTDRVHVIAQAEPFHVQPLGNVTVVEQQDGFVLIDAGGSRGSAERIVALVRRIGSKPVKAIVLTHWHADHSLGAATLMAAWPGAELIATRATARHLAGPEMAMYDPAKEDAIREQLTATANRFAEAAARPCLDASERAGFARTAAEVRAHAADLAGTRVALPTRLVEAEVRLDDLAAPIELMPAKANTDSDLIAWMPRQRVLATGDVVVSPVPFGFDAFPRSWVAVVDRLLGLNHRYLVPGHGAVQTGAGYIVRLRGFLADVAGSRADLSTQVERIAGGTTWLRRWATSYWAEPIAKSAKAEGKAP
jgi:glyoxylase-like metal-dependent hydrolase (beta-lactamase superfamily II)